MQNNFEREVKEECNKLLELLLLKNEQYGDSFKNVGKALKILYPNGIEPWQYGNLLGVTRVLEKLFRIAKGNSDDDENWGDVSGEGMIMKIKTRDETARLEYGNSR